MMKEIWKPVVAPQGNFYAVSNFGRVFSFVTNIYLKPSPTNCGYLQFGSILGSAHRLVCKVFIGRIPEGYQVNHIDGDKSNNKVTNLEIVTPSENVRHAYRTGLMVGKKGQDNSMARVTEESVLQMYEMFLMGKNNDEVSELFGLHSRYISLIRHGKRWSYLYESYGRVFPKSYKFKLPKCLIIMAYRLIKDGYTNKKVSEITGIEPSMVSRIRTGNCYRDFIEGYTGLLATTIP